jgi:hypothetical protein
MSLQKRFADEIKRDAWRRLFIAAMLLAQWLREVARCIRGTFESIARLIANFAGKVPTRS